MKVPAEVISAAAEEIAEYGEKFTLLGEFEGKIVYKFRFPKDEILGFPFLYLYKDHHVEFVTGWEAISVIRSLRVK